MSLIKLLLDSPLLDYFNIRNHMTTALNQVVNYQKDVTKSFARYTYTEELKIKYHHHETVSGSLQTHNDSAGLKASSDEDVTFYLSI